MAEATKILVIDDEESICFAFRRYFESRGYAVDVAATGRAGIDAYRSAPPEVVFLDVRLPDASGLDILEQLRAEDPAAMVVIITAYGSLETVTRAMRNKAFEYLVKPLDLDQAAEVVSQVVACRRAMADLTAEPPAGGDEVAGRTRLVGASPAMQEVYKRIGKAALSDVAVLILGQTGTGKEIVARAIHEHSARRDAPFVAVNCGALPENLVESELFGYVRGAFTGADADKPGRFEAADGGTLMLDEVGELPPAAQVKLLRFLDTHSVERLGSVKTTPLDVRIIAATNRDLSEAIRAGRFRDDLFYRLAVLQIELPPLAARSEDVVPLAQHFLRELTPAGGPPPPISPEAAQVLRRYTWPGNVRELRNAVEHARTLSGGGPLLPSHLPEAVRQGRDSADRAADGDRERIIGQYLSAAAGAQGDLHRAALEPVERALLERVLAAAGGNQTEAAARLGVHRNTLRNKIRQYGLDRPASPGAQ